LTPCLVKAALIGPDNTIASRAKEEAMRFGPILALSGLSAWLIATTVGAENTPDDPYLWLEQQDSPKAMEWVRSENDKTLAVLQKDSHFEVFDRVARAIAEDDSRIPMPEYLHRRIFNFWQDARHVRGIWRYSDPKSYATSRPHWSSAIDLDALAKNENTNWVWQQATCEPIAERRCLIELSDGGEDASTAREFDLDKNQFIPDGFRLPHGKQRAAWEDRDTLLVAREWNSGELTASGYPYIVKRLRRGQSLDQAEEVFRGSASDGGYGVEPLVLIDAQGHRAVLIVRPRSTFESETYLVTDQGVVQLNLPKKVEIHALAQNQLIISLAQDWQVGAQTFEQGSLVAVDLIAAKRHPDALHPTMIYRPGPRETFLDTALTRDGLLVATLENVKGRLSIYHRESGGAWSHRLVQLPDNSAVSIADSDRHGRYAFISVNGFLQPPSLWRIDSGTASAVKLKQLPPQFDASNLAVQQLEATSSDGTRIPYFLVAPKRMRADGNNPTILTAYGGFQVSLTPRYSAIMGKLWLERGGVFVVANIRGGGEFGPAWHEAGLKTRRQIIYDDFTAVARDLIARHITSPRRLGIEGGSNGGLLMGVEFTQHPELWGAVDIQVPLLDMLRYEFIDAGTSWVGEYGSVSDPVERSFLASISPYANVRRGTDYPRPLVWTTTKDDRVGPQHARKFAARLSEFGIPYLFYEETEGGHGAGANLREKARTNALELTYFTLQLADQ
jgi:prolyl oligopeptidase